MMQQALACRKLVALPSLFDVLMVVGGDKRMGKRKRNNGGARGHGTEFETNC
jgi:hypothetical protein